MERIKRWACVLMSALMLICACPQAKAAESIDVNAKASLAVNVVCEDTAVPNIAFKIYKVADIDAAGKMTLCGVYASYPIILDCESGEDWDSLAATIKGLIDVDGNAATATMKTDEEGKAKAENLSLGLYLIVGSKVVSDGYSYSMQPALVSLPGQMLDGTWTYEIQMLPKVEREKIPEDFINSYVTRRALKIWGATEDPTRPNEVEVYLLRDGAVYETVKLSAANNWRYDWEKLPEYAQDGSKIEWTLVEKKGEGYTVRYTANGLTMILTNSKVEGEYVPPKDVPPTLPLTGLLWWPVPVMVCAGLICLIVGIRRHKSE